MPDRGAVTAPLLTRIFVLRLPAVGMAVVTVIALVTVHILVRVIHLGLVVA